MSPAPLSQSTSEITGILDTVKDPGFSQWLVYLLVFMIIAERLRGWVMPMRPQVNAAPVPVADLAPLHDALGTRMDAAFTTLHQKIDPLIQSAATATALIDQIDKRLSRLESLHTHEVRDLHTRIDEALRGRVAKK